MDLAAEELAVRTKVGFYSDPAVGFIEVAGPEARTYLQNLTTNDIRPLVPGQSCESFFTTHKARTIAHVVLHCVEDQTFLLAVDDGRATALFAHLDRHLISERAELKLRTDLAQLRVVGPGAMGCLIDNEFAPGFAMMRDRLRIHRRAPGQPLDYDVVGPAKDLAAMAETLKSRGAVPVSAATAEILRIESGWPAWGREMDENRFVVELGRMNAISYSKGCYLGQEPIVMARDRGHVNRRLMKFTASAPLDAGAKILQGEVELFRATSTANSPATIGLAFVRGQPVAGEMLTVPTEGGEVSVRLVDSFADAAAAQGSVNS